MLGSGVYRELRNDYELVLADDSSQKLQLLEKAYGSSRSSTFIPYDPTDHYSEYVRRSSSSTDYLSRFIEEAGAIDYVINTISLGVSESTQDPGLAFFINSALPHLLATHYAPKLIQATTDCVYNGKNDYPYDEKSTKDPVDIYGLSKSMGEPVNSLILRTSIIGRELKGFTGLLEWFLRQNGKSLKGFTKHFWNGITATAFGRVCVLIMNRPEDYPKQGIYHIYSTTISKYEMLQKFKHRYNVDCEIEADASSNLNRSLCTNYSFNNDLKIPSFDQMLDEMPDFTTT